MADLENKETEVAEAAEEKKVKTEKAVDKKAKNEKSKKAAPKKNKVGFGARIKKFFKDYKSELKKIVWLSPKTTVQYTGMVLGMMIVVSVFIGLLDLGFSALLSLLAGLV
ncbi:MAG: preprotein translocase subunit SecE [Ruminococcaceae bacterium]|nr:preprotein translocase subunit SecE [Oscillospiraceae bacterium]